MAPRFFSQYQVFQFCNLGRKFLNLKIPALLAILVTCVSGFAQNIQEEINVDRSRCLQPNFQNNKCNLSLDSSGYYYIVRGGYPISRRTWDVDEALEEMASFYESGDCNICSYMPTQECRLDLDSDQYFYIRKGGFKFSRKIYDRRDAIALKEKYIWNRVCLPENLERTRDYRDYEGRQNQRSEKSPKITVKVKVKVITP